MRISIRFEQNHLFNFHINFIPVVCFLKTGIRPMNGNFLPALAAAAFFAAAFDLSEFLLFLSTLESFLSPRRSRDFDRE